MTLIVFLSSDILFYILHHFVSHDYSSISFLTSFRHAYLHLYPLYRIISPLHIESLSLLSRQPFAHLLLCHPDELSLYPKIYKITFHPSYSSNFPVSFPSSVSSLDLSLYRFTIYSSYTFSD